MTILSHWHCCSEAMCTTGSLQRLADMFCRMLPIGCELSSGERVRKSGGRESPSMTAGRVGPRLQLKHARHRYSSEHPTRIQHVHSSHLCCCALTQHTALHTHATHIVLYPVVYGWTRSGAAQGTVQNSGVLSLHARKVTHNNNRL